MSIFYNQQQRVFRMDTPGSTYLISIVDEEGFLCHTYYGRRIPDDNMVMGWEISGRAAWR